jgi:prevent-host-death family protein
MTTQSLAAAKAHFSQVIDEVTGTHERVTVTKNGSPVAVILAVEDYESLVQTPETLSDPRGQVRYPARGGGDGRRRDL